MRLTERYLEALQFAGRLHANLRRRGSELPHFAHLIAVSALVVEHGGDEDEAIAALLEDAVHDCGRDYHSRFHLPPLTGPNALKRDIAALFGLRVLAIVDACTNEEDAADEPAGHAGPQEDWHRRRRAGIERLRAQTDLGALRVACADRLHYLRGIYRDYLELGEALWQRLDARTKTEHVWYFNAMYEVLDERARVLNDPQLARMTNQLHRVLLGVTAHDARSAGDPLGDPLLDELIAS
jgi:(p)ppGpp synthase/HD superfamily hydrolase